VSQDRDRLGGGALLNAVMKLGIPQKCREFLE